MVPDIPSVTSPWGVNNQIIQHGVTGYLPNSKQEWFKYLTKLIRDESIREKMGKVTRKIALIKYSIKKLPSDFDNIIKSIGIDYIL